MTGEGLRQTGRESAERSGRPEIPERPDRPERSGRPERPDRPGVSVIVPVYNSAAFIIETLESITAQTYKDVEIIVVDDGSSDGSSDMVLSYVDQNNSVIRVVKNKHQKGAAGARNTGIDEARGRYIAFIDSDDKWVGEKIEKQIDFMRKKDSAFSFTGYEFADEKCKGTGKIVRVPESISYKEALRNTTIFTSTVMFDMDRLSKEDIVFPYIASEDTANWWKILRNNGPASGLDEALTLYRRSAGTLSSNKLEAIKRVWALYRKSERLSIPYSLYCFAGYAFRAVKRRV